MVRRRRLAAVGIVAALLSLSLALTVGAIGSWQTTVSGHAQIRIGYWGTPAPRLSVVVKIAPRQLGGSGDGGVVTALVTLPEDAPPECVPGEIAPQTVALRLEGGSGLVRAHQASGTAVARQREFSFYRAEVVRLLAGRSGPVTLVVSGPAGACAFSGSDTILFWPRADVDGPGAEPATPTP